MKNQFYPIPYKAKLFEILQFLEKRLSLWAIFNYKTIPRSFNNIITRFHIFLKTFTMQNIIWKKDTKLDKRPKSLPNIFNIYFCKFFTNRC